MAEEDFNLFIRQIMMRMEQQQRADRLAAKGLSEERRQAEQQRRVDHRADHRNHQNIAPRFSPADKILEWRCEQGSAAAFAEKLADEEG